MRDAMCCLAEVHFECRQCCLCHYWNGLFHLGDEQHLRCTGFELGAKEIVAMEDSQGRTSFPFPCGRIWHALQYLLKSPVITQVPSRSSTLVLNALWWVSKCDKFQLELPFEVRSSNASTSTRRASTEKLTN